MWLWRGNVIRYDMKDIDPLITMFCVRNWMTDKEFCDYIKIAPWTLRNWRREWSIPVSMVHKLRRFIQIDFMNLTPVNTNGVE